MAHNLNFNEQTGRHSFFSVKEKAWHGLGQIVTDYPTSKEAIIHAGLDYEVVKRPIYTHDGEINKGLDFLIRDIEIPEHFATIRTDNNSVLGVVGKDYQVIQNIDAFTWFDSLVAGGDIKYETAGALGQGERIFITAKLPGKISVGKDDLIEKYLFLTTSHDGFGSIVAGFTPVRVVCNNTLTAALRNHSNSIKIRHTVNAKDRLNQASKVLEISKQISQELEQVFNRWSKVKIHDPELKKLIQLAMIPNKEVLDNIQSGKVDQLSKIFQNVCDHTFEYSHTHPSQQQETTKGSLFGAFNAVTGYFQNCRSYKSDEAKLKSLLYGGIAQTRTQKAFNLCEQFEKNGLLN